MEREEAAECPTYMNTTAWLGLWCLSVNRWSGFGVPFFNAHLSQEELWREGLWLWSEAPTADLTTAWMPAAGVTHEARHLLRLCIRGTRTHTHTFLCVHHILPRCAFHEHTRQLGPSSSHFSIYFFFCEHRSHIHEFTPLTVQMLGVVKQLKFWCRHTF